MSINMVISATEVRDSDELLDLEKKRQSDSSDWVLNAPEHPGLCRELFDSWKETVLSHGNRFLAFKNRALHKQLLFLLHAVFPILHSFRNYTMMTFKNDVIAGLTIASLSIPQSIGYATLAGLHPQYGLYASVVPPLVYSLLGSSSKMIIGPVAVDSLLLFSFIHELVNPATDPDAYTKLVLTATLFVGIFQFSFGLFRLGFLLDFLSQAAVIGFTAGAAIIIGLQQLKELFGILNFTTKTDILSVTRAVWRSFDHKWNPLNLILGCSFLFFILISRFLGKRKKKLFWLTAVSPLLSFVLSTLIVYLTRADKHGVNVVKEVRGGLNPISVKELKLHGSHVGDMAKVGLIISIISLMEAIAVARSFTSVKGCHLNANKEMAALGFTNIIGSFFSCYVTTGSLSRTAVNISAGCETGMSSIVMAVTVSLSLQLCTKLIYFTPKAIIASIILSALPGLINMEGVYYIWKIDKLDFLICLGSLLGVLFSNVQTGLIVAVAVSFAKIILIAIRSGINILGRLPGTESYGDVDQYPMATQIPEVLIIRIKSAWLCFANANSVKDRIIREATTDEEEEARDKERRKIQILILDMSSLMDIDTAGVSSLEELHKSLGLHGIVLSIASPRWQVINKLRLANFLRTIEGRAFLTVAEAVDASLGDKMISSMS